MVIGIFALVIIPGLATPALVMPALVIPAFVMSLVMPGLVIPALMVRALMIPPFGCAAPACRLLRKNRMRERARLRSQP